jgi:hypothetical protein
MIHKSIWSRDMGKPGELEENLPQYHYAHYNPTWTAQGMSVCSEKVSTNCLCYCTTQEWCGEEGRLISKYYPVICWQDLMKTMKDSMIDVWSYI